MAAPYDRLARATGVAFALLSLLLGERVSAEVALPTYEELTVAAPLAVPPLPPSSVYPIQLVHDDDQMDGVFGLAGGQGARQFLWFERFTTGVDFELHQIWVLFPSGANMTPGAAVQLAVYHDPDGDPANGATLLASYATTIQATDDGTFSVYALPAPLAVPTGDVLVGVVNRFVQSNQTSPTSPAALDSTTSAGRAWFAVWSGDPPDPPVLAGATLQRMDDAPIAQPGNWMIRGFGVAAATPIPALDWHGAAALAAILAALAGFALRRR